MGIAYPASFFTAIEMTPELKELIISAKAASLQIAAYTRASGCATKDNHELVRIMAAITAMEKSQ